MTKQNSRVRAILAVPFVVLVAVAACATSRAPAHAPPPPAAGPVSIERWSDAHPQASRELGDWARGHEAAARRFFEWDGHHPERSHEFVTWTITHPRENIDGFVAMHRGWPYFDEIAERHRPAADAFMFWCRRHPQAAESLMDHPRGLEWVGHHLYGL